MRKRIIVSIILLLSGILIYYCFNDQLIENKVSLLVRNHLADGLWIASFFFIATVFSKKISKRYILLTSIYVITIGILFEMLQLNSIIKGTFDLIDIVVYIIFTLISCLIEKMWCSHEKI